MPPGPRYFPALALLLLSLAVAPSPLRAQPDVTPLDPDFRRLPEIARRQGYLSCDRDWYERYGMAVHVLARGAKDTVERWIVQRQRCDTTIERLLERRTPTELLLYMSGGDTLPPTQAYSRIGPEDVGSFTSVLTSADLDQDGHSDLVCAIRIIGDTSYGNRNYYVGRVVVFWGRSDGRFTLADTSQIPAEGLLWLGPNDAVHLGNVGDSSRLFILTETADYAGANTIVPAPPLRIYSLRRGERWGRNGVRCRPVWTMWNRPPVNFAGSIATMDHDGDGNVDVVFYRHVGSSDTAGWISVFYGQSHSLPDSHDVETVYMAVARGRSSLLQDITGDGIPELLVHGGNDEVCRIYVGLHGQRLMQQYGSGSDPERPAEKEWWGRPWVTLRLPRAFWTGWGRSERYFFNVGDGNGDGVSDIWLVSSAYLLCYTTGEWLDEYADGLYDLAPGNANNARDYPECYAWGDILGPTRGGVKIVGMTDGVRYLGVDTLLPRADRRVHRLPPGTGRPTTAVPVKGPWPWRMDLW